MYDSFVQKLHQLPTEYPRDLLPEIAKAHKSRKETIIVLDDDPTGTQTCQDVIVLTRWDVALLLEVLKDRPSILFILTNSRSLPEKEAMKLVWQIGINLKKAIEKLKHNIVVISRSDSTLRGHFPSEVTAINNALNIMEAIWVVIPAFLEGGRYTIDDVHYIVENDQLIPVSETQFARDVVFGYQHANLRQWVEEKTKGMVLAMDVVSVSLSDLRLGGPGRVMDILKSCHPGDICIINAASYRDIQVAARGMLQAESEGMEIIYRSSATFVPIRAGLESGKIYIPKQENKTKGKGSLIVVGSHVPKSTQQLQWLLESGLFQHIEVKVPEVLKENNDNKVYTIAQQVDNLINQGENVVIYTSRKLEVGNDKEENLHINARVSDYLVRIIQSTSIRPYFMLVKGGITSSDLASKGLGVTSANVLGPVIPGVPVWCLDDGSKYPGLQYVVFPGNVGDEAALETVFKKFVN